MARTAPAPKFARLTDVARTLNLGPQATAGILEERGLPIFRFKERGPRMVAIDDANRLIAASRQQPQAGA